MDIENRLREAEAQVDSFEKMLNGADRLTKSASGPWKWAVVALAVVVAICVSGWMFSTSRHMDTIDRQSQQITELTERIIELERSSTVS